MANSRSLLVYVLALVLVVKGKSWVNANTIPVVRDLSPPLASSSGGISSQLQSHSPHQQHRHHHPKHEASQQLSQHNLEPVPLPPSSAPPAQVALPPKQQPKPRLNNAPTTLSLKNSWGLAAGNSDSGPYTSGYGYITGRTLNSPANSYMTDVDLPEHTKLSPETAMQNIQNPFQNVNMDTVSNFGSQMNPIAHTGLDMTQVAAGTIFGFLTSYLGVGTRVANLLRGLWASDEDMANMANPPETNSRRKRDVDPFQENTDLTELANIVLAAIQSGECMQRSICLLGSRIGNSGKGRAAFSLVDKLIPESVQTNQYFVTMKKALKGGESFCDRFRCRFN